MVARIHSGGKSFGGVVSYLMHDKTEAGKQPKTSDRVGFVAVENLVTRDPLTAARVMAGTAYDAPALKQLSGESTKGRKLTKPVYHYSLNWSPDEPRPDQAAMREAVQTSLDDLGMTGNQALLIEHTDTPHPHVHVVVNRVDPETGRAASTSHDARKLSSWARCWEQFHGDIQISRYAEGLVTDGDAVRCGPAGSPAPVRGVRPGRRELADEEKRQWRTLRSRQRLELAAVETSPVKQKPAKRKEVRERHSLERAKLSRDFNIRARKDAEDRAVEAPAPDPEARSQDEDSAAKLDRQPAAAEQPAASDDDQQLPRSDGQHRQAEQAERQRAAAARAEEAHREAVAARKRRWEALASFPGAYAAAHEQFDRLEPGWRESGRLTAATSAQVLERIEAQVDKSLDKQEANLRTRLQEWDDRGQDLLMRARTSVLGSGQAQPADRRERAQVLDAADRLDIAERTVWGVKSRLEESMEITPSHRSIQAAAREIAQNSRKPWERDIADAIAAGNIHLGADDPGPEGETKQIRAKLRTIAQSDASEAADREHAEAMKAWEQVPSWRRWAIAQPERPQPREPDPPKPEDIERRREGVVFHAKGIIRNVLRAYQPQLDPEYRSEILQEEARSQSQSRQQPQQDRGRDQGGPSL